MEIIDRGILSHRPGFSVFSPCIESLANGSFIACQDVGTTLGSCDHSIEILHSLDGREWENQGILPGARADDEWFYRNPDIKELTDGRLVMRATRFQVVDGEIFNPENETLVRAEAILYWSEDQGRNWSDSQIFPVPLPPEKYTWNGAGGRLICISPSRWMYAMETFKPEGSTAELDQKAIAVFSSDQGRSWDEMRIVADDESGHLFWWDQMSTQLPDGRIYTMLWTHIHGTNDDLPVHWVVSEDEGRNWSQPKPTNIRGQVCSPIALPDGRVAAVYNYRKDPPGVRIAITGDLSAFDLDNEIVLFSAGQEAAHKRDKNENFLDEHLGIAFGKPSGILLNDSSILIYFWCTSQGITHTRWIKLHI